MGLARFFVCIFILSSQTLRAQIPTMNGWVYNKKTLETIAGAIIVDSSSYKFVETNAFGHFQFSSGKGNKILFIAARGFKSQRFTINVESSISKNFFLMPVGYNELDSAEEFFSLYNMKPSFYAATKKHIIEAPSVLSVSDPIKYLQFLPGVSGGIEGLSGLLVRGSNPDQNLILMNGMPIYGNGHIWGFVSNYNPEILQSVHFYRGVAPARFGGRAGGGVLDVQTDGGAAKEWTGKLHVDPIAFNLVMNGPLDHRGKVTGSFAFRRSYLDWILGSQIKSIVTGNIHDANIRINFKKNQYTQWNYWFYNGRDKYGFFINDDQIDSLGRRIILDYKSLTSWQNTQAGIRWSHEFNANHFGSITAGYSRYNYVNDNSIDASITQGLSVRSVETKDKLSNAINDLSANADFSFVYSLRHTLRYGSQFILHGLKPGITQVVEKTNVANIDTLYGVSNIQSVIEWSQYAELDLHPNIGLSLNIGIRLWSFFARDKAFIRPEPRIILSQLLEGKKRIQLGFSIANQGLHQLSSVNGTLPRDVWFPSGEYFKPQSTTQVSAAFLMPAGSGIEFSTELFYKNFRGITDLTGIDEDPLVKNFWERSIVQGSGTALGFEMLLIKQTGKFTGLMGYTYSKSTRTFDFINNGEQFPYRWDRPHQIKGQLTINLVSWLKINFAAVLMSGNVYSIPTGKYLSTEGKLVYDYNTKNNYRMPTYKRIDLGFTKEIKPYQYREYKEFWGIQLYNTFGWVNPLGAKLDIDKKTGRIGFKGQYFSFIPSGFYRLEF